MKSGRNQNYVFFNGLLEIVGTVAYRSMVLVRPLAARQAMRRAEFIIVPPCSPHSRNELTIRSGRLIPRPPVAGMFPPRGPQEMRSMSSSENPNPQNAQEDNTKGINDEATPDRVATAKQCRSPV
jgi:hypothetical protein